MVDSEFIPPLTNLGDQGDLRGALIRRVPYTFTTTDNPEDYVAVDAGTGSIPWALVWAGRLFYFDPDDLTTAHDGITTIVTSDGYRYKVDGIAADQLAVLSRTVTAPPALPTVGDSYLVPSGSTGDWATHPNNIAIWTARGWRYIPPEVGQLIFVESESGFYHYGTGGAWTAGIGGSALGAGTVRSSSLIGGRTHWVIVNQTTNTPPGSPANGVAYIVGPSPMGAWAGQSGRIAVWEINAWVFYIPQEGWTAYNQALNSNYIYNGTWNQQASGYSEVRILNANGSISPTIIAGNGVGTAPSATVAPVSTGPRVEDTIGTPLQIQADYAGQWFEITYRNFTASAAFTGGGVASSVWSGAIGLFIDSETSARDWYLVGRGTWASGIAFSVSAPEITFAFPLADTSVHQVRFMLTAGRETGSATVTGGTSSFTRRRVTIRKLA